MNTAYKSVIYNTRLITDKNVLLSSGLHHGTICTSPLIGTKSPPHRPWNPLENFRHSNPYFGRIPSPNPRILDPPVTCTNELRRNHPMRPVGRVPSYFGDHGDQVLWCPPLTFATGCLSFDGQRCMGSLTNFPKHSIAAFKGRGNREGNG